MSKEPRFITRASGIIERVCEHGVGHPIDHLDGPEALPRSWGIHGCDGCCKDWPVSYGDDIFERERGR